MRLRKIIALLLTLALCIPVCAWAEGTQSGTITIWGALEGQTYSVYRIFDLTSFAEEENTHQYAYTVHGNWSGFFAQGRPGADYITLDANGHPTWNRSDESMAPEFAKAALKYAADNHFEPEAKQTYQGGTLSFSVPYGYYVLSSSLGTVCSLGTTNPSVTIEEKNVVPSVTKTVSNAAHPGEEAGGRNTAAIGDTLNFRSVITVGKGTFGYVYHDKAVGMDISDITVTGVEIDNYEILTKPADGCTFHIRFEDDFISVLPQGDTLEITYKGKLNASAVIQENGTQYNTNTAWLGYSNTSSVKYTTETASYSFSLKKVNQAGTLLSGAHFKLYTAPEGGTEIPLVKDGANSYRPAVSSQENTAEIITDGAVVRIFGLDRTVYYLEETKAPEGYHERTGRIEINLNEKIGQDIYTPEYTVVNNSGTKLPSTGGMGTTAFYVAGTALMALAVLLLVKRRKK